MPSSTGALIGITSALLDKWFAPKNYKEEYFIGHKVAVQYGWVIMYLSHNNFSKLFAIVAVLTNLYETIQNLLHLHLQFISYQVQYL